MVRAEFIFARCQFTTKPEGVSFFYDSGLLVTSDYNWIPDTAQETNEEEILQLVTQLAQLGQHWEKLLFPTLGTINFQKSFWYVMHWTWKHGVAKLIPPLTTPYTLKLTTGDEDSAQEAPMIYPNSFFCTLGVLSSIGNQNHQISVLWAHSDSYFTTISNSSLSSEEAYLCPWLRYPLTCTSLTQQQCLSCSTTQIALKIVTPPCGTVRGISIWGIPTRSIY
jgi:hypothetical protein